MSGLDVVLAVAGLLVTVTVIVGMILLVPAGSTPVHSEGDDPEGSNPSPVSAAPGDVGPVTVAG